MAKLAVISHKPCWPSSNSPSGYATDGGFPMQMRALSELFETTAVLVPCSRDGDRAVETHLTGNGLTIVPLSEPGRSGPARKAEMIVWLLRNGVTLAREIIKADGVHIPIPGDIGTIGMLMAFSMRKPLFVRHCGNWTRKRTEAERFWRWFMEKAGGGRNVMLATGGADQPPSQVSPEIHWIFSTSLTAAEIDACAVARGPIDSNNARLIIVGRQEKGKGVEILLESIPILINDFPGLKLDVVGDGSAINEFKALATALGIESRVIFHGKVDHPKVIELLKNADLFCFPTASEGFPKAVIEAMACGLPVVTTPVSALPYLISDRSGVIVEARTPQAFAGAIQFCLGDAGRYAAFSENAQATARGYSLEKWRDEIGAHLRKAWGPLL